jgi:uncharacterized protein YegP (UPF0339 family)
MFFHLYRDVANQWRWILYATNGRKIADSAEGYFNKADCLSGIRLVKLASGAPIRE